jgi:hypothetical protein
MNKMEYWKYFIFPATTVIGIPLLLVTTIEHLLFIRRVKKEIYSMYEKIRLRNAQQEIYKLLLRIHTRSRYRRLIFPLFGFLLLIYIEVKCFRYIVNTIYVKEVLGPEGLLLDLWAESLRLFAFPVLSETILIGICGLLYIVFTLWHERFFEEIYFRLIIETKIEK